MNLDDLIHCASLLSRWLEKYNRIFLAKDGTGCYENLTAKFCEFIGKQDNKNNILLLSCDIPEGFDSANSLKISPQEELRWIRLFHLYAFSDRFRLIAPSRNQGDIFNFVRAGKLRMEEAFQSLLR